jgi:hypothetical protein
VFESERIFISNTKTVINSIGNKKIPKLIEEYVERLEGEGERKKIVEKNIIEWINGLENLGCLRDFIVGYYKNIQN